MTTATATITQTDSPSRSKMAGPCWIAAAGTYASTKTREISAEIGAHIQVTAKVELRRVTRSTVERNMWTVVVTGRPTDTVTVRLGSPQAVEARLTGVVLAEDWVAEVPAPEAAEEPRTATARDMAQALGVSLSTIYRRIRKGLLNAVKNAGRWAITIPTV